MDNVNNARAIVVNDHEYGLIVSGLRRVRSDIAREIRKNRREGFQPEPGKHDVSLLRRDTLASLMDRLGID